MLFALGFIYQFMMGGFSGLMHANAAHDLQQHDTYFVVAHFHYVLIGGALFGLWSGIYYWYPKITGRLLDEKRGHFAFWFLFVGFNTTFFPMHWLGLNGMPRRIYSYQHAQGWDQLNLLCTIGAFTMAVAVVTLFYDMFIGSLRNGKVAGNDPWDARTLEWSIPSPPPAHNFDETPTVKALDDFWVTKHPELLHEDEHGEGSHDHGHHGHDDHGIHMPGGTWMPLLASVGFAIGGFGLVQAGGFSFANDAVTAALKAKPALASMDWAKLVSDAQAVLASKKPGAMTVAEAQSIVELAGCKTGITTAIVGGLLGVLGIFAWSLEPIGGYFIHLKKENEDSHHEQ